MSAQATHSLLALSHSLCLQLIAVVAHFNFASSSRQEKRQHTLTHTYAETHALLSHMQLLKTADTNPLFVTSLLAALRSLSLSLSFSAILPLSRTVVAKVVNLMSVAFKLKRALSVRCWSEREREGV